MKAWPSPRVRGWLWKQRRRWTRWPPVGHVSLGAIRRLQPISREFGFDRGRPIDRYYIEWFLRAHAADIQGQVLEVGDDGYTRQFGDARVTRSDVLHVVEGNPRATLVGDLTHAPHIASETFDCVICTQTLQFIFDVRQAIMTLNRILKPDGVLLATVPCISQISRYDIDRWGEFWRFTSMSARRLFEETFPAGSVTIRAYGNVLAAVAFLHGLAAEDLSPSELDHVDDDYELVIAIRARKAGDGSS
ncbi:MAG: methyltransferase domain-containing protein [bacterium]